MQRYGDPPRLWRHRDWRVFRGDLDAEAQALFRSGEEIRATFDGFAASPGPRWLARLQMAYGAAWALGYATVWHPLRANVGLGLVLLAGGVALWLSPLVRRARRLMVALTTDGIVVCGVDRLGRPRVVLHRGPSVRPVLLDYRQRWVAVSLDGCRVFAARRSDPVLQWAGLIPARKLAAEVTPR